MKKLVRIIKANQQENNRTSANEKPLELKQFMLQTPAAHPPRFKAAQFAALKTIEKIAMQSRVVVIEGISGSGKDTLQSYLKEMLSNRDVYDYSEGEVLHSWKHLQIDGIAQIRLEFMRRFVSYIRRVITQHENSVFLLNRFHLSTYATTIIDHPELEPEYAEMITALRMLPVHVFILQLSEPEIEARSLHPERSTAWQNFQKQIAKNNGFCRRLAKQQQLILQAATTQQISYSSFNLYSHLECTSGSTLSTDYLKDVRTAPQLTIPNAVASRRKRRLSRTL